MAKILIAALFQAFNDYGRKTEFMFIQQKHWAFVAWGSSTLLPFLSSLLISTLLLHKTLLSRRDQTCQDNAGAHPREDGHRHRLSPLRAFVTCLPVLGEKLYLRRKRKSAFVGRKEKVEKCENKICYSCCWFCLIIGTIMSLCSRKSFQTFKAGRAPPPSL